MGGWCPGPHANSVRDTGLRSSKGRGPWGNKGQTSLFQGRDISSGSQQRKEVHTAQWGGSGSTAMTPLFPASESARAGPAQEFPTLGQ